MNQVSKSTTTAGGVDSTTSTATTTVMSWDVQKVHDDGSARVQQKICQVKMKMTLPGVGDVSYDSANPDVQPNPLLVGTIAMMKALLDTPWDFTMNQQGKITEVGGTEKLDAAALAVTKKAGMAALPSFSQTSEQASAIFPEAPVKPGQTWDISNTLNSPIGRMTTRMKYTFVGNVVTDGRTLKKISFKGALSLEPLEAAPVKMELKHGVLEGTYLFDNEKGVLVEQQTAVTMTIAINDLTELKSVQTLKLVVRE